MVLLRKTRHLRLAQMAVSIGQSSNVFRRKSRVRGVPRPLPRMGMARVSEIAFALKVLVWLRRTARIPDFGRISVARRETPRSLKPPSLRRSRAGYGSTGTHADGLIAHVFQT